jgi:hypothetical protein
MQDLFKLYAVENIQVSLGRVRWLSPMGLLGFGPIGQFGPVSVGPSETGLEGSLLEAASLEVFIKPLDSVMRRRVVFRLAVDDSMVMGTQTD